MSLSGKINFWQVDKPRWCSLANSCPWINCKFYHKRCVEHVVHASSGGRTPPCPYGVACEYDHRDFTKLRIREAYTEMDMWDDFWEKGLDAHSSSTFNMSEMKEEDREELMRRLEENRIDFDSCGGDIIMIYF
jgi:hypothetical protein